MREPSRRYATPKAKSRKKSVNLSIDGELLRQAKASGINLSRFVEERLAGAMKQRRHKAWQQEAREAMEAYNEFVAENGIFGEEFRCF